MADLNETVARVQIAKLLAALSLEIETVYDSREILGPEVVGRRLGEISASILVEMREICMENMKPEKTPEPLFIPSEPYSLEIPMSPKGKYEAVPEECEPERFFVPGMSLEFEGSLGLSKLPVLGLARSLTSDSSESGSDSYSSEARPSCSKAPLKVRAKSTIRKPTYQTMVTKAIECLDERGGSSRQHVMAYIVFNYGVSHTHARPYVNRAIRDGVARGVFALPNGYSGKIKLAK
jgi:hypothetical protein